MSPAKVETCGHWPSTLKRHAIIYVKFGVSCVIEYFKSVFETVPAFSVPMDVVPNSPKCPEPV